MLSMSMKSQAEVFSQPIQSKHQFCHGENPNDLTDSEDKGWMKGNQSETHLFPFQGTSFPPGKCAHQYEMMRSKFHSESDLTPGSASMDVMACKNSNDHFSSVIRDEVDDSDLFFDFDFEDLHVEKQENEPCIHRRHSTESLESDFHAKGCNSVTTYGSESSGLSSDFDCLLITQMVRGSENPVTDCLALKPENWFKQQQDQFDPESSKSATPIPEQSPSFTEASNDPVGTPYSLLDENEAKEDKSDEFDESVRVTADYKHKIAHSKLNALLALLDKDKGQQNKKSSLKDTETTTSSSSHVAESSGTNVCPSFKNSLPTTSSDSPANFSFLSSTLPPTSTLEGNHKDATKLSRCESTPELTSSERAFMDSPQLQRRSNNINSIANRRKMESEDEHDGLEVEEEEKPPMRRASSLKSGKTPPGTPGRRKIVRFADVFGLDLADVKTFLDEVPRVPRSAYRDLKDAELSDIESDSGSDSFPMIHTRMSTESLIASVASSDCAATSMVPMFNQPGGFANFFDLLRDRKVCVENAFMGDPNTLRGTIRVQNIGFEKKVTIRYTLNEWMKCIDMEATYMSGSCDGFSDKFTFVLRNLDSLQVGQRLQFCVKYETNGVEFWDNNNGKNYVFQCLSKTSNKPEVSLPISTPSVNRVRNQNYGNISQSPSALSDEPWLRYL